MVRILVTPERLNDLSQQMTQSAMQLRELESRLGRALSGLDWEARQQVSVDGQVNAARTQARQLAEQAETLARYLTERAGSFQQADAQGVEKIGSLSERFHEITSTSSWNKIQEINQKARKIIGLGEFLAPLGAASVIVLSLKGGAAYAGEVIINLPNWLKNVKGLREIRELSLLPGHFNHVAFTNLPSKMLKWGVVFSIPAILSKWQTDIVQYKDTELASALLVDAALTLAPVIASFIVSQTITWGATALGTVIFPGGGTVAGYAVGTAAASLISGTAANLATQWAIDNYHVREQAIESVDNQLQSVVREIKNGFQQPLPAPLSL